VARPWPWARPGSTSRLLAKRCVGAYIDVIAPARNAGRADQPFGSEADHPAGARIRSQTERNAMLDDIYNRRILELAADIPRLGRLPAPDASATAHSKLCGSTVTVDLAVRDGTVTDFAHEVKACALGQASSSLMARHVVGASAEELREVRAAMRRMLKENGPAPAGTWADLAVLEPVRDFKARHASTLLTFDAVVDALDRIEARAAAE
jgi:NifU-like protein involved in Fe-S cluster formation